MRIVLAGPYPENVGEPSGGVQSATENLVTGLSEIVPNLGIDVVANSATIREATTVETPFGTVTYLPQAGGLRGWARNLHVDMYQAVAKMSYDVLHVQGLASLASRFRHSILTIHGLTERDVWNSRRTMAAALVPTAAAFIMEGVPRQLASNVITVSHHSASALRPRQHTWHIPNAIHPRYFELPSSDVRRGDPRAFATIGSVSPLKNTAGVLKAFAKVTGDISDARLAIVGPGVDTDYGRHCLALVRTLKLNNQVEFVGAISGPSVLELLRNVGTLVQFSLQENSPVSISEALAAGARVIGTTVGAVPEMLGGHPGCDVVAVGDYEALAGSMLRAANTEDLSYAKTRHQLAQRFSPRVVAAQTMAVYEEVARRS